MFGARDSVFHLTVLRVGEPAFIYAYRFTYFYAVSRYSQIHRMRGMRTRSRGIFKVLSNVLSSCMKTWFVSPSLPSLFLSLSSLRINVA